MEDLTVVDTEDEIQSKIIECRNILRTSNDKSNCEEFTTEINEAADEYSARTSPSLIDRNKHMKTAVIDNQDKFLKRSLMLEPENSKLFVAAEERIRNLETHFGVLTAPCDKDLFARIKILEDKVLKIEQHYPQIAAHCFNYGNAEREASQRPGGRVTKMEEPAAKRKALKPATLKSQKNLASSAVEIKNQINAIKEKLKNKK